MSYKSVKAVLLCLAAIAILALAAAPAQAIVGGQFDGNDHPNVGALEMQFAPGEWYFVGSCTLVGEDVVLTAAHCVDWVVGGEEPLGVENVRVTFDPLLDPQAKRYYAESIAVNTTWGTGPVFRGNSKYLGLGPGNEDEALVWLKEPVMGITPAKIVAADGLNDLDLADSTFTVVGYGVNGYVAGNGITWRNPQGGVLVSGRNYKDVSVVTEHEAFPDRYVKITASLGFGDSGGPLFYEGVEVAINVATMSYKCVSPGYSYRLDAPLAHGWPWEKLGPDHFTVLPK